MLGAGADLAVGIDPGELFVSQFRAPYANSYPPKSPNASKLLPLGIEHMPKLQAIRHRLYHGRVLYHRRSPIDFLQQCIDQLRKGGELILETTRSSTAITPTVLVPRRPLRANAQRLRFLPSSASPALPPGLERLGMKKRPRVVDECLTTTDEQRRPPSGWESHSLADFLDPNDASKTIEGYPPPNAPVSSPRNNQNLGNL